MKNFLASVKSSGGELRNLRSLTGISMLLAVSIVLTYFFRIDFGSSLSIGFSFVATALMGMLYGPIPTMLAQGIGDIIKYMLRPRGAYLVWFTFNVMLAGVIYGLCLYRKKPTIMRVIMAKGLVNVVVNSIINTYLISLLYGDAFNVMIIPRLLKNVTMLPVEIAILYFTLNAGYSALKRAGYVEF